MKIKLFFIGLLSFLTIACSSEKKLTTKIDKSNKVKVLNFGSVHLSGSTDANSSVTNINNPQVKKDIKQIVNQLVRFKPTIICVEIPPASNDFINTIFQKYKTDQSEKINYSEEVNVIGLEVARLSGAKKIYGIDNPIGFNYPKLIELANNNISDSLYVQKIMKKYKDQHKEKLLKQYELINLKENKMETFDFYNFLATMHSSNNFEGADIIAEFYKRNLRMFTNFSDIPVTKNDRILIIMGATHTAYFDVFIENSSKYILEDVTSYIKYAE